jgi:hypothetical protein
VSSTANSVAALKLYISALPRFMRKRSKPKGKAICGTVIARQVRKFWLLFIGHRNINLKK